MAKTVKEQLAIIDAEIESLRDKRAKTLAAALDSGLLPCPFCGASGELNPKGVGVECVNKECGAIGPSLYEMGEEANAEAVRLWNKRAASQQERTEEA